MSKNRQTADAAQKGPGLGSTLTPQKHVAPSFGPAGNTKSGSSQSNKRGKQGQ